MKKYLVFNLLFLCALPFSYGQKQSLNQRWGTILDKSETYQHYKVIKKTDLADVWKNVEDTIAFLKKDLTKEGKQIENQKEQIAALEVQLSQAKENLGLMTTAKDQMMFMGAAVNKYSYVNSLWITVFSILAVCLILFFLFNRSNSVTKQKISDYEDLFDRFEEYKKSKIEMERKLKRELQTQLNLLEEDKRK
jgi:hypothetical protein